MLRFIYDKNERNYSLINRFMSQRVVADEVYQLRPQAETDKLSDTTQRLINC